MSRVAKFPRSSARHFIEVGGNIRPKLEAAVEALLEILDQLDGDTDLEDGADDEPALGSTEDGRLGQTRWTNSGTDDLEQEPEHDEPSLGSPGLRFGSENQELWAQGTTDDCEEQHDREADPAEHGICDLDALNLRNAEITPNDAFRRNLDLKRFQRGRYAEGGFKQGVLRFPTKQNMGASK